MKYLRRMITGGLLGAVLAVAMAAPPAPAQAAGITLYVDDTAANNELVSCPASPAPYPNLQSAVASLGSTHKNVTIIVCQGIYPSATNAVVFAGFTNLKIMGRGIVIFDGDGMTGALITVINSTKVTVSGLIFDGGGNLGGLPSVALYYTNSSGTIKNNIVSNWHEDYGSPLNTWAAGIYVSNGGPGQKVVIDRNTVTAAQTYGILLEGPGKAQVSRNRIYFYSDTSVPAFLPPGPIVQAGVALFWTGPGVKVTGNVIDSNAGLEPKPCVFCLASTQYSRGVLLMESSKAQIKGNTINYMKYGISLENWCFLATPLTNNNAISKNKLYNNGTAVNIIANNYYGTVCDPHVDHNKITGNKINRDSFLASRGVWLDATLPATAAGNVVKGNTFYGYPELLAIFPLGNGVTGLVDHPNKLVGTSLTGAAPQQPEADRQPQSPPPFFTLP